MSDISTEPVSPVEQCSPFWSRMGSDIIEEEFFFVLICFISNSCFIFLDCLAFKNVTQNGSLKSESWETHLKKAAIGWKKQMTVVMVPRIACGLSTIDQPLISTQITTKPAMVSPQVRIMQILCHCNENVLKLTYVNVQKRNLQQTTRLFRIGCFQPRFAWNISPVKCL